MFHFLKPKQNLQNQKAANQGFANHIERYNQEISPYVSEGLIRVVFQTKAFTITCAANSAYAIYFHEEVDKKTNLTWGFYLKGNEFQKFMEEPTMEQFKYLNYACQQKGENRAVLFTPQLADKMRALKKQLDAQKKVEVDLDLEKQLVEAAKRKYAHKE